MGYSRDRIDGQYILMELAEKLDEGESRSVGYMQTISKVSDECRSCDSQLRFSDQFDTCCLDCLAAGIDLYNDEEEEE